MKPKQYKYKTILFAPERGGVYAGFPFDGLKEFGKRGPVRVNCRIGSIEIKCSLLPMGDGSHAIHVKKDLRKAIGKDVGDEVEMIIEQDLSPRIVIIPEDIQWLLDDDPVFKEKFDKLTISYKESIIAYIDQAKLPETRAKRIGQMIDRIKSGLRRE